MDFKKFVSGASTAINRAVQKTEETFLQAEKTEYDPYFLDLARKCDITQSWTENIIRDIEIFAEPNPGFYNVYKFANRMEHLVNEKLDRKQTERTNAAEELGNTLMKAGGEIGLETAYGKALMKAGQSEIYIGKAKKQFGVKIVNNFIATLKSFLNTELKNITAERKSLENLRLDLDLAKNKHRKAKSEQALQIADSEFKKAQGDFDDQLVIAKLNLEGIKSIHSQHLEAFKQILVEQREYYAECHKIMNDLTSDLNLA